MKSLPAVQVLLATFNGERFLREQIDSILSQDYENIHILARDDGSSDQTVGLLNEYAQKFPERFCIFPGNAPTGSARENFLLLMKASTANYVCFSDQDDVWLPSKVSVTMSAMLELETQAGQHTPLLVFTDLRVVNEQLVTLHESFWARMSVNPKDIHRLEKPVARGVVTGCTMMVNRTLLNLSLRMPQDGLMHDRWISVLASVFGRSKALHDRTVLYRQHGRNLIGVGDEVAPRSLRQRILESRHNASLHLLEWQNSQKLAQAFLSVHAPEMPEAKRKLLLAYRSCEMSSSRSTRVATFLRYRFYSAGLLSKMAVIHYLLSQHRKGMPAA
jgi:hypothetical protein